MQLHPTTPCSRRKHASGLFSLRAPLRLLRIEPQARGPPRENRDVSVTIASDSCFTGKEADIETGLVYFGKRFYSPHLQRWMSPDPLAVHVPGAADLNLYAYVRGQALRATDPFGLQDTGGAPGWDPNQPVGSGGHEGGPGVEVAAPNSEGSELVTNATAAAGVMLSGPASGLSLCGDSVCEQPANPMVAPIAASGPTIARAAVAAPQAIKSLAQQLDELAKYVDDFARSIASTGDDVAAAASKGLQRGAAEGLKSVTPRFQLALPRVGEAKSASTFRVTEKGLARVEQHLDDVITHEMSDLPRAFALRLQAGERGMVQGLRSGERSSHHMEFYVHELKESAIFRSTKDLPGAHQKALRWRGVTERDLFHPDVVRSSGAFGAKF